MGKNTDGWSLMLDDSLLEGDKDSITSWVARKLLQAFGWTTVTHLPPGHKFVIILAPHTSYWDYPLILLYSLSARLHCRWIGHNALFIWPLGYISRALGGFKLDRRHKGGTVKRLIRAFAEHDQLVLGLAPEATKAFVPRWRTGFYHIALGAQVPLVLAFVDYQNKSLGCSRYFMPSGNTAQDEHTIRFFYRHLKGKNPQMAGPVKL
ncbi:MAG: 1-acyl-sn-glycerol-3-phosphate acyltransferase [Gammaproteobacteria bacterium]|nr:1-acyl-sn-glycerol-3-phosphate acyltransferase [Gammaproteobacteria bacterium]